MAEPGRKAYETVVKKASGVANRAAFGRHVIDFVMTAIDIARVVPRSRLHGQNHSSRPPQLHTAARGAGSDTYLPAVWSHILRKC